MSTPVETFPALAAIEGFTHGFLLRDPDVDTATTDRAVVLGRLAESHRRALDALEIRALQTAEQVHGDLIVESDAPYIEDADGLIAPPGSGRALGIYVADCCAVWIVDPVTRAHAVLHSGRKGSELGIAPQAVRRLIREHGSDPADLIVQLSPCIRPPLYEIDFARRIRAGCLTAGIPASQIHDSGTCTGSDLAHYYSYRVEKGATGRMLAVAGFLG
jgi:hypothetical protein